MLPVAANPAISLFGFSLAGLVSGSLLVEVICGWPGLGPLVLDATLSRDLYVVIGGIMFSALFMVAGNLIADVMLMACDPRIRTGVSRCRAKTLLAHYHGAAALHLASCCSPGSLRLRSGMHRPRIALCSADSTAFWDGSGFHLRPFVYAWYGGPRWLS